MLVTKSKLSYDILQLQQKFILCSDPTFYLIFTLFLPNSALLSMLPWPKPAVWPLVPPDASSEVLVKEKVSSQYGIIRTVLTKGTFNMFTSFKNIIVLVLFLYLLINSCCQNDSHYRTHKIVNNRNELICDTVGSKI